MKEFVIRECDGGWMFAVYAKGCRLFSKWFEDKLEAELFADYYTDGVK